MAEEREQFERSIKADPEPVVKDLSESVRVGLLKLVLGMAISKYGYVPGATRNRATGEKEGSIRADLQNLGLDMDNQTIKNRLDEAMELFKDSLLELHKS